MAGGGSWLVLIVFQRPAPPPDPAPIHAHHSDVFWSEIIYSTKFHSLGSRITNEIGSFLCELIIF